MTPSRAPRPLVAWSPPLAPRSSPALRSPPAAARRPAARHPARRLLRARGGSTAVEFGLLALPLLLLVAGIMDCSRLVWTHLALQVAVEQAARCAVIDATSCGTPAQVQSYAASMMLAPGVTAASFSYAAAACGRQVSASMSFAILVPGYLPASIPLTARSCAPA